jgi:uncharacterized NAD-dependent epimerase/dehydratase family protein
MAQDERPTAAVLAPGLFRTPNAKTAHGLVRGPSRHRILGVIDPDCAGEDAGTVLDGRARDIPVFASLGDLAAAAGSPAVAIVGVATSGGVLPEAVRSLLLEAARTGASIVSGLHTLVADDAEIAAEVARHDATILDLRRPRPTRELRFWSGEVRKARAPRIAVLGTDCALGKRTTTQALLAACAEDGLRAAMVYTGQTGWLQGVPHGFILDATPNDFVSGELERAILACDRDLSPDVIFLEGQSALRNPSGPCGAELLLSAEARAVVLQHAPARRFFDEQEELKNAIPPVEEEIALIRYYGATVLGLALNEEHLAPADREGVRARIEQATGRTAVFPLTEGVTRLLPAIREHLRRA